MKKGWMAISVTTMEAFMDCIRDECLVISIEQPLLDSIRNRLDDLPEIQDYHITWYNTLETAILKKVRGTHRFDDERFYVCHYFLGET